MCGLPAAKAEQYTPVVMFNVLGDLLLTDGFDWSSINLAECHVHMYGKAEARIGRKMGHINFVGEDVGQLLSRVGALKPG